jgi:hypothetical protein
MGTRGFWGFVVDGQDKFTYNHFDSYPEGLGSDLMKAFRKTDLNTLKDRVRAIVMVGEDAKPTDAEQATYGEFWHDVSTGKDWYSLLRDLQGDFERQLEAGVMVETVGFQEYGYVFDLDKNVLRLYDDEKVVGEVDLDDILNDPAYFIDLGSYYNE